MVGDFVKWVVVLSIAMWVFGYLSFAIMQSQAEKVSFTLRIKYLESLMKQEIAYFEKVNVAALPSEIAEYFVHISDGIGF